MKKLLLSLSLVFMLGCGYSKVKTDTTPSSLASLIPPATLPEAPPVADTATLGVNIDAAGVKVADAQQNVKGVLADAAKVAPGPIAQDRVVPPLNIADKDLDAVKVQLKNAEDEKVKIKQAADASETARLAQIKALKDRDAQQDAAIAADKKANADKLEVINKAYDKANAEIDKLKNEVLKKAKYTLMGIALLLFLGGATTLIARFYPLFAGALFLSGIKVTIIAWPLAALCLFVATILAQIMFWTGVLFFSALALAIAYGGYELYKHARDAEPIVTPTVIIPPSQAGK